MSFLSSLKLFEYVAMPEKYFTSGMEDSVKEASLSMTIGAGVQSGAFVSKDTFHGPVMSRTLTKVFSGATHEGFFGLSREYYENSIVRNHRD